MAKFQEHFVLIKDDLYFIKVMHHLREGVLAQCSFDIVQNLQLRQTQKTELSLSMWPLDTSKRQNKHNTYEAAITITAYCFLVNLILELADGQGHSSSLSFHFPHHANFDLDGFIFYLQKELYEEQQQQLLQRRKMADPAPV